VSSHSAIAAVTAALHVRLRNALAVTGLNAEVSHTRPGTTNAFPNKLGVHLFLYMVTPNATLRNVDLPTRDGQGRIASRPTAALELHYLLSFLGEDLQHEPQRMLGAIATELHANPVLTPDEIRAATLGTELAGSRLEQQIERVRMTSEAIDLEEFSKLWSVFFQTQYLLSVAYKASVVLLEADVDAPVAGRVRQRGVYSAPLPPEITSLSPQVLHPGEVATIRGTSLVGASTTARFVRASGEAREVAPSVLLDDRLEVTVPADLPAGIVTLQLVTRHVATSGPLPPRTFELESGPVPFMLAPRIVTAPAGPATLVEVSAAVGSAVTLEVVPPITAEQDVRVLAGSVRVRPSLQPSPPGGPTRLIFVVPALEPGQSFPLRVEIDRAVSLVEEDGPGFKPRLTIPGGP
jgi:hypothetical protein